MRPKQLFILMQRKFNILPLDICCSGRWFFVPPARIKRTAHDGQGHMCEIKSSECNICLHRVFSAGFTLDLPMTTRKHLLKVRLCLLGSQSQLCILRECGCLETGPRCPGKSASGSGWGWKCRGLPAKVRECPCVPVRGEGYFPLGAP